jgi:hypothetical protein
VAELLALLDIGTRDQRAKLASFHAPKMLNTMGIETSRLTFSVTLSRVTDPTA